MLSTDSEGAWAVPAGGTQTRQSGRSPCCCSSAARQLADSTCATNCSTISVSSPFHPRELEARLRHLLWSTGDATAATDLVEYGDLALNLETYQATIAGRPLDLTYMEYELLKFLAQHPGKVFTREMLLSAGVGLRVLRRRPHGRRPHSAPASQARRRTRQPDRDRPLGRLPLRPVPLEQLILIGLGRAEAGDHFVGDRLSRTSSVHRLRGARRRR